MTEPITTQPAPALACPGCGSPDVHLDRGLLCRTCAATVAEEAGEHQGRPLPGAAEAYYAHKACGGTTIWDLSGGFCTACHAEGLDADDVEQREVAP